VFEPIPFHQTPIRALKGVGSRHAKQLARIGITTVQDLLFHLPLRYEDRTQVTPISALRPGDQTLIEVDVQHGEVRMGRRRSLLVLVADASGALLLRFFTFSPAQREGFKPGVRLRCYGEVRQGPDSLEIVHPECHRLDATRAEGYEAALTPVYPSTEGLHQLAWRAMTSHALELLDAVPGRLRDLLPEGLGNALQLPALLPSLRLLHRPPPEADRTALSESRHPAQYRLAFEELLAHQIALRRLRLAHQRIQAPPLIGDGALRAQLLGRLPFQLTAAQQRVVAEIAADLGTNRPMQRLLQGDVGSGKTVVAALAALQAVEAGCQVALMAPTELLAEQHLRSLHAWLAPLGVELAWLKRQRGRGREAVRQALACGRVQIVIGTHALFQADVTFQSLALIIVDEQHRFGVHQRLALWEKGGAEGRAPHQLIMTATPIPRSLTMTAYADLDLSVIDEQPPGRTPVVTVAVSDDRRMEVIDRVRAACAAGRQAYWVCTLIEESEVLQCQAAENTAALLQHALGEIPVGLVHGRMKSAQRETVMAAFKDGALGLLVATTIIEVGVDVPNASLMIIENPERLGLAQLHQLRGRVGRGRMESHCLLLYHAPLSAHALERLRIIRGSGDGFAIARQDLELRGPGEVLGTRQAGELQFQVADLMRHQALLAPAQRAADRMLQEWPREAAALEARWLRSRREYGWV